MIGFLINKIKTFFNIQLHFINTIGQYTQTIGRPNMTLPCKDCITLSICRSYYLKKSDDGFLDWMIRERLETKCRILYDYRIDEAPTRATEFHRYMKWLKS